MKTVDFQEILDQNGISDILTEESWADDYAPDINFTVKEIKEIAKIIKRNGEIESIIDEKAKEVSFYHINSQMLFEGFIKQLKEKIRG